MGSVAESTKKQEDRKCTMCEKSFSTKTNRKIHEKRCEINRNKIHDYPCRFCKKVFNDRVVLKDHCKEDHPGRRLHECHTCAYIGITLKELDDHKVTHSGARNFKCQICDKLYSRDSDLLRHMNVHEEKYKCERCGFCTTTKSSLKKHLELHERSKFKCLDCDQIFEVKSYFADHINKEHPGYKPAECTQCGKRYPNMTGLCAHIQSQHKTAKYECEHCGKKFHFRRPYLNHLELHEKLKTDQQFHCFYCENTFTDTFTLKKHISKSHQNRLEGDGSNRTIYSCPKCTWKGDSLFRIVNHLKTHADDIRTCQYCSISFSTIQGRRYHENRHFDEQGNIHFNCYRCPKKFEEPVEYARHLKTHTLRESRLKCRHCTTKFRAAKEYAVHMIKMHEDKIPTNVDDGLTTMERLIIDSMGFLAELTPGPERNEKGELAFNCRKCGKMFYGHTVLRKHYVFGLSCRVNIAADSNALITSENNSEDQDMENNSSHSGESCSSNMETESEDYVEEDIVQLPSPSILSDAERGVEFTPLPLTVAVLQYTAKYDKPCVIIWCKKLEADLMTLVSLSSHDVVCCVFENTPKKIDQLVKTNPSCKLSTIELNMNSGKIVVWRLHAAKYSNNFKRSFASFIELENDVQISAKCNTVVHFMRSSKFGSVLMEELKSKMIICNSFIER